MRERVRDGQSGGAGGDQGGLRRPRRVVVDGDDFVAGHEARVPEAKSDALSEADLWDALASYEFDPLGFVYWAFPWGEPGTELADQDGPDEWQREVLAYIGERLAQGGDLGTLVQVAVRSGHGVGKSALTSWIILWAVSTFERTRGVATAMTDPQLRTKTWAELSRWHGCFIAREYFTITATSIKPAHVDDAKEWRIDATPWSETQPAAFAGLHNHGRRLLVVFDEASEIHDEIWRVTEGALTDENTQIIWCVFGNPTKPVGKFFDCFTDKGKRRWKSWQVDSRKSKLSNKKIIQAWLDEYGEDSDFFRVRARGLPPRAGVSNFISPDLVRAARDRVLKANDYSGYPIVMALDPAEFGDNESVLTIRQGPKIHKQIGFSGLDGPDLASRVVDERNKHWSSCQWVGVEGTGIGADVVSSLKRVPGFPLFVINPAMPAGDDEHYFNVRAEMWGRMRKALETAQVPDEDRLQEQLTSVNYGYDGKMRYQLESKKDMRSRGIDSPDRADSLALSYVADTITRKPTVKAQALPQKRRLAVW